MTEEIPECCQKYDSLSEEINQLEAEIADLYENLESNIVQVKENIQIIKDAKDAGIYPVLYHVKCKEDGSPECSPVIDEHVSYFEKKIYDLNRDLLKIDEAIKLGEEKKGALERE
ncbi:MAG: hypothetical protein PHH48_06450, partial [Eubacteriales bacterium]|nr:hypothetical protein [Eubacteriales bacterium]